MGGERCCDAQVEITEPGSAAGDLLETVDEGWVPGHDVKDHVGQVDSGHHGFDEGA